jgi:tetratricopeptide (TPR) repeat protein
MDNSEHLTTTTTIELNNYGVALMLQGDYKSAIASFAKALETSSKQQRTMEGAADDETAYALQESLDQWMSKSMRLDENMSAVDEQDSSAPFVCRSPIHIITAATATTDSVASSTDNCFRSGVMTSAILFFNTALTYHESAMGENNNIESSSPSSSANVKLGKAALLYELAYKLQLECSCHQNMDEGDTNNNTMAVDHHHHDDHATTLFIMAIINNLGTVYGLLDNKESAEKCFQHLLSTLMFDLVVVGGAAGCEVDAVSSSNLDGFHTNTSYLYLQDGCTAAAA